MTNLNQQELSNLRHLIYGHQTAASKLSTYAQQCTDPQLKQFLTKSANEAQSTTQKLMSFLQ